MDVVEVYVEVWGAEGAVHDYVEEEWRVIGEMFNIAETMETVGVRVLDFLHVDLIFLRDVAFLDHKSVETFGDIRS